MILAKVPVKGPEAKLKGGCEGEGAFTGTHRCIYVCQSMHFDETS